MNSCIITFYLSVGCTRSPLLFYGSAAQKVVSSNRGPWLPLRRLAAAAPGVCGLVVCSPSVTVPELELMIEYNFPEDGTAESDGGRLGRPGPGPGARIKIGLGRPIDSGAP